MSSRPNPLLFTFLLGLFSLIGMHSKAQTYSVILGRPTNTSITLSVLFDQNVDCYIDYGISNTNLLSKTNVQTCVANTPVEIDLTSLTTNTKYYYRIQYKTSASTNYKQTPIYSFQTQRAVGTGFTFTVESDEHLYDKKGIASIYQICLNNQALDNPDFMLSLGDIFGDDHNPLTITSSELDLLHKNYRPFLGSICHSIPFFVCLGNHEGENDYYQTITPPNNLTTYGTYWRKYYYPNPFPNNFYTGNTDIEPYGIGNPENYYAWTWGDALFVVLDVYRYQNSKSEKPQGWDWSLGSKQYNWLKTTLETSTSKYKFVFAHHVRGQGRGGITNAKLFEWGGYEQDGTTYSFATNRPGWAKPIHQLFKDTKVNIFFQGHDHLFAHEVLDGVHYQEVPMPSDSTYMIGKLANADAYVSDTIDGTGHIRVTVNNSCIKVDYVKAFLPMDTITGKNKNREIAFSYLVGNCTVTSIENVNANGQQLNVNVYPNPTKEKIFIDLKNKNQNYAVTLIDNMGKAIIHSTSDAIDITKVVPGIYFLKIKNGQLQTVKKVIINN